MSNYNWFAYDEESFYNHMFEAVQAFRKDRSSSVVDMYVCQRCGIHFVPEDATDLRSRSFCSNCKDRFEAKMNDTLSPFISD